MKKIFFILLFFIISSECRADQISTICDALDERNNHKSVTYTPGVDVHGNPVIPANVNNVGLFTIPEIISFPLSYDLARDIAVLPDNLELTSNLATIEIHIDGNVYIDGESFSNEIQSLCNGEAISEKRQLKLGQDTQEKIIQSSISNVANKNNDQGIIIYGEGN